MFNPQVKFQSVLDLLSGEKSLEEICQERNIEEELLTQWQYELVTHGASIFATDKAPKELTGLSVYPGGTLMLDESLRIVYTSPKFGELFDCTPADVIGQHLEDIFSPKDRKGSLSFHNKLARYEQGFLDIVITLNINQREFLARLRMMQQQKLWIVIFENILAESDDLFRQFHLGRERWTSIVRNSSEGIAMLDVAGRIVEFNSRFLEIMQFRSSHEVLLNEDAILNKNIFDLMSHQAVGDLRTAFENAQTTKRFKFEQEILHRHYNLKIELTPIYLPVQGFAGCSLVIKDITAQKQLEDTIAELDAYAHTVAHDLKNPLGVISGYADFIELKFGSDLAPGVQGRLQKIIQTSRKMAEIVDELLLLASVRNQADVELTALNMGKIIQSALERFGNTIAQANAQIIIPDNWLTVYGYAPWVEEIWVNYISNALKYGGTPPVLEFGFGEQDSEVRFWLKDNGNAMSDAELANLFTEFTRLDRHTSSEGHGLGLSIVQRIAHKLGGSAGAESTAEEGSLFYFTLPYAP